MSQRTLNVLRRAVSLLAAILMVFSVAAFSPETAEAAARRPGKVKITSAVKLNQQITVKWKKTSGARSYQLYLKAGSGKWKKAATVKANGKSTQKYVFQKLKWNTTYQFKMRAVRGSAKGPWSKLYKGKLAKKTTLQSEINKSTRLQNELRQIERNYESADYSVKIGANGNNLIYRVTYDAYDFSANLGDARTRVKKAFTTAKIKKQMRASAKKLEIASGISGIHIRFKVFDGAGNSLLKYTYK